MGFYSELNYQELGRRPSVHFLSLPNNVLGGNPIDRTCSGGMDANNRLRVWKMKG